MALDPHMAALAARTAAAWRAEQPADPVAEWRTTALIAGRVDAHTAYQLISELRINRPELVHFAGAAHRDPLALEVCREYQRDPTASEADLRARASATVYGGGR